MNDGREYLKHHPDCTAERLQVQRARIVCLNCDRFAPRTDVEPGVCGVCGGTCRPDMPVCALCRKASHLRTPEAKIPPPASAPTTPPRHTSRLVCRGCYRPVMVKVKPGGGFICTCSIGRAA